MDKKNCPRGQRWDRLVGICIPSNRESRPEPDRPPQTEPPVVVLSPVRGSDQADAVMLGLSPALCATAVLVTVGSILALAVWLVIYRRQTRHSTIPADAETAFELLHKTEPPATIVPLPSESNGQFTTCSEPTVQKDTCAGLPACSTASKHRIPLPATELGGTALVTTKTV